MFCFLFSFFFFLSITLGLLGILCILGLVPIAFYPRPIRPIMHIRPSAYRLYTMHIRPIMHIRPSAYQPPIRPTMPIMPSRSSGPIHLPFGKKTSGSSPALSFSHNNLPEAH